MHELWKFHSFFKDFYFHPSLSRFPSNLRLIYLNFPNLLDLCKKLDEVGLYRHARETLLSNEGLHEGIEMFQDSTQDTISQYAD